jgi:hypothetical protein
MFEVGQMARLGGRERASRRLSGAHRMRRVPWRDGAMHDQFSGVRGSGGGEQEP